MIRIFLTGDNHIGLMYAGHEKPEILQEKRITAFEGMVREANRENCGLFVIAGDLFHRTTGITRKTVGRLMDLLAGFQGTVAVLPGNHDYYDGGVLVWQYFRNLLPSYDNIMLLSEDRPYSLVCGEEDVVLYPAVCRSLHSEPGENNLTWIKHEPFPADSAFRIGIAHGAVEGETIDREGSYFLMKREELEKIPVDVWLLGHTHVPFPQGLSENAYTACGRIFNAGTHVQTDVSCNTDGECFLIQIDADKTVRARKYRSGNVRFYRKELTLSAGQFERQLNGALGGLEKESVVDVVLSGAVSAEEYEDRHRIVENALAGFLEGSCHDAGLSRLITKAQIGAEFPETSFAAGFLNALLADPKEAQLAYELLKSLKGGE